MHLGLAHMHKHRDMHTYAYTTQEIAKKKKFPRGLEDLKMHPNTLYGLIKQF